jgi:RNA polymerase sigma factor (sigma-70 family)
VVSTTSDTKFRRAFDAHFDAMNRYCLRRIPVDDVNDVVAEVFAVAWRKVDTMPDGDSTLPWLYRVAHHEISNRRRSKRRFRALVQKLDGQAIHPEPGPESVIVRNSELDGLLEALNTLGTGDREVLLLRTHEDLDYSQMSVALGCSPEAARKRLTRAIRRLRQAADIPEPQTAARTFRAIEEGGDQ